MKDLKTWNKKSMGEIVSLHMRSAWYFETAWEKIILIVLANLGLWKIFEWIF